MTTVIIVAFAGLTLSAFLVLARLFRAGVLPERIVALDTLLIVVVAGIATHAVWTRSGIFLDALVVVTLLAFTGTVTVARFIEKRGL